MSVACEVCYEFYAEFPAERRPRALPRCGHDFCTRCIAYLCEQSTVDPCCPTCRTPLFANKRETLRGGTNEFLQWPVLRCLLQLDERLDFATAGSSVLLLRKALHELPSELLQMELDQRRRRELLAQLPTEALEQELQARRPETELLLGGRQPRASRGAGWPCRCTDGAARTARRPHSLEWQPATTVGGTARCAICLRGGDAAVLLPGAEERLAEEIGPSKCCGAANGRCGGGSAPGAAPAPGAARGSATTLTALGRHALLLALLVRRLCAQVVRALVSRLRNAEKEQRLQLVMIANAIPLLVASVYVFYNPAFFLQLRSGG